MYETYMEWWCSGANKVPKQNTFLVLVSIPLQIVSSKFSCNKIQFYTKNDYHIVTSSLVKPPTVTSMFLLDQICFYGTKCSKIILTCLPSIVCVVDRTVSTQLGSLNVTKPNPRDFPVCGFFMTTQSHTSPNWAKYCNRLSVKRI